MKPIIETLCERLVKDTEVLKYQLSHTTSQELSGGFLNNKLGGIYRPIQAHNAARLAYQIEFSDGQVSKGGLPASTEIEQILRVIQQGKHSPSEPIEIAPKQKVPAVELVDPDLKAKILHDPAYVSTSVKQLQQDTESSAIEDIEGEIELRLGTTRIMNSHGLDVSSEGTRYHASVGLNSRVGYSHNTRLIKQATGILNYCSHFEQIALALDSKPAQLDSGTYPVLFSAGTGWGILSQFLRHNLDGFQLNARQSRYTLDDFSSKKQIAHPDFSLHYDQTSPMDYQSFKFDGEGVTAQKFTLIQDGKLTAPVCDLKSARQLGFKPKSLGSLKTKVVQAKTYDDFVHNNETFLLVFGVLGLHSVNSVSGDYSLPSDNVLLVRNGKIEGPINAVLTGNFFDNLMETSTHFVNASHLFDSPALTLKTQVTIK